MSIQGSTWILRLTVFSNGSADLAFSLICGSLFAALWGGHSSFVCKRLIKLLALAAGLFCVILLVQSYLLTATMTGDAGLSSVRQQLRDVMFATHAGRILIPQCGAALLIAILSIAGASRYLVGASAVSFLLLSVFRAATGHASSDGDFALREWVQWMHLVSMGMWSGGVIVAGILSLAQDRVTISHRPATRLSRQATVALCFVLLSGVANIWLGSGGAIGQIPASGWGRILIAKLVLVLVVLGLGFANRRLIDRLQADATIAPKLERTIRYESLIMVAILFLSGWLAATPPIGE